MLLVSVMKSQELGVFLAFSWTQLFSVSWSYNEQLVTNMI